MLATGRDFVGENPVWNEARHRLYWVDVLAPALRWYDPASRTAGKLELPHLTAGIAFDDQDRLVCCGQHGLFLLDPDSGATRHLIDPEADRPDNRFNTAGIDPHGRLWAGTMAVNRSRRAAHLCDRSGPDGASKVERVGMPKNVAFGRRGERLYRRRGEIRRDPLRP